MYIPGPFEETSNARMHDLIRAEPLSTLVVFAGGALDANHIPMIVLTERGPNGTLQGHLPRANPLVGDIGDGADALAIFHGPEGYISPSWYATKKETGKVVPTWNYAVVHAHGVLRVIDDPQWVRTQIDALTLQNEAAFPEPWSVSDAPEDYTARQIKSLVGIELRIERLTGKTKASQNHPARNRQGVIRGLEEKGDSRAMALAALTRAFDA